MNTDNREKKVIAIAAGDGIGPEVMEEAKKMLKLLQEFTDYTFELHDTPVGGNVFKKTGTNFPYSSEAQMRQSDAILFGAVGLPDLPLGTAETVILKIRHGFEQYVNLRPLKLFSPLRDTCPLKDEYIQTGIDLTIVRENSEGLYTKKDGQKTHEFAQNIMRYSRKGVERLLRFGFEYAKRKGHTEVMSVDKANLLECSQFWREIFLDIGQEYPTIQKKNMFIDAFVQWVIRAPYTIQTVVTENMFGDIISDEAAYLIGSLGMAASGNINPQPGGISMYEPIHGSAPDIAGKNIANPIGMILSVKLMLEESFADSVYGPMIEDAVISVLKVGRTEDILPQSPGSLQSFTTSEMGEAILRELKSKL
jgi:3-isopropylmalate dehydrogenase